MQEDEWLVTYLTLALNCPFAVGHAVHHGLINALALALGMSQLTSPDGKEVSLYGWRSFFLTERSRDEWQGRVITDH